MPQCDVGSVGFSSTQVFAFRQCWVNSMSSDVVANTSAPRPTNFLSTRLARGSSIFLGTATTSIAGDGLSAWRRGASGKAGAGGRMADADSTGWFSERLGLALPDASCATEERQTSELSASTAEATSFFMRRGRQYGPKLLPLR